MITMMTATKIIILPRRRRNSQCSLPRSIMMCRTMTVAKRILLPRRRRSQG
jgi:hypothetical protein